MSDFPPLSSAAKNLKPGRYRHFKGGEYQVLTVAFDSETLQEMVVYRSLKYDRTMVRPLKMFLEEVDWDGYQGPRFAYLGEDS